MDAQSQEPRKVSTLDGGWDRLARDLRHATIHPRIPWTQFLLIYHAQLMSWTLAQIQRRAHALPFKLNLAEIAKEYDLAPSGLYKEHRRLVGRKIFTDLGDGRYLINKDYRTWVHESGNPLLPAAHVRACLKRRREARGLYSSGVANPSTPVENPAPLQWSAGLNGTATTVAAPEVGRCYSSDSAGTTGNLASGDAKPLPNPDLEPGSEVCDAGARNSNTERVREREESSYLARSSESASDRQRATGEDEATSWAKDRLAEAFPGDESLLENATMWIVAAIRQGWSLIQIQDVVVRAVGLKDARRCLGMLRKCFSDPRPVERVDPAQSPGGPHVSRSEAKRRALLDSFRDDEEARP